jgi:SseB protein N-terminal domain
MSAVLENVANPGLVQALLHGDGSEVQNTLAGSTLLVPASENGDGETSIQIRRGAAGRRLVCAFTDLEALQAWDRSPADAAVALDAAAVAGLVTGGMVALNPAGPGALVLDGDGDGDGDRPALAAPRDDTVRDRATLRLTDPEQRTQLRRQANQFHELARRTAEAGDLDAACEQLQPAISACEELGDRLHGAAAALELASWRARSGSTRLALTGWREAAATMAALGELDLAVDALLDAAQTAARAGLAADAEALSVTALDLVAGSDFSDRLIGVWRMLTTARTDGVGSVA